MKTINRRMCIYKKLAIVTITLMFLFVYCKDNNSKVKNTEKTLVAENQKNQDDKQLKLLDVTRFFEEPENEGDVNEFKKNRVYLYDNEFIINDSKVSFTKQNINCQKILGKGSLYDFFRNYIFQKFKLKLSNEILYINVDYEDATIEPFKKFFLSGKSAIIIDDYLFLYSNDNYLLTYKIEKNINIINDNLHNNHINLPFDYEEYTKFCIQEISLECQKRYPILEKYNYDKIVSVIGLENGTPSSIFNIKTNNDNFDTYLLNYEGDSSSQDIITISNDKIISTESLGYAMPEEETYDTFVINSDLSIDIYEVSFADFSKKEKKQTYKISSKGKIIKN